MVKIWEYLTYFFHLSQIRKMKMPGRDNKTAVVVGTVTDDVRIQDIPKLKVTPLCTVGKPLYFYGRSSRNIVRLLATLTSRFVCCPTDLRSEGN